jgi:regulator of protease activity HflC (stomatin/prohibitin superfamily)
MSLLTALFTVALVLVAAFGVRALLSVCVTRVVVVPHEAVLALRNGRDLGRLAPGVHRFFLGELVLARFDLREGATKVAGQEVLTRDRVSVKFTVLVRHRVFDALRARDVVASLAEHLHAEAQLALRAAVPLFELEELLENRAALSVRVAEHLRERLARVGLELVEAAVQDVMVAGELKHAFGEVARARAEGLARLERARGEAAALRSLANAARLFREHEGLERLKLLALAERAAEGANNTLVLGLDPRGAVPSAPKGS